jgi:hypothetical protein
MAHKTAHTASRAAKRLRLCRLAATGSLLLAACAAVPVSAPRMPDQANLFMPAAVSATAPAPVLAAAPIPPAYSAADKRLLARVMWAEAGGNDRLGMLAVGVVVLNRAAQENASLSHVIMAPYQFSSMHEKPCPGRYPAKASPEWQETLALVERLLGGTLRPDETALAAKLGGATHFYAPKLMKAPCWARNGKLRHVPLPKATEISLGHRFYGPPDDTVAVVAAQ